MIIKFLSYLLLFLLIACGERQVNWPDGGQGQAITPFTYAEQVQPQQSGTFIKNSTLNSSLLNTDGKSYPFSEYSSHQALSFYAGRPMGSQTPVKYRGQVKSGKMVIEQIQPIQ